MTVMSLIAAPKKPKDYKKRWKMQLRWFWRDLAAAVGHLDKAAMILNLIPVSTSVSTHLVYATLT